MKIILLYIDPGSGSYLVQMIIAAILGSMFFFKNLWLKFKSFFVRSKKRNHPMTMNMHEFVPHPASYRDPSGFVFPVNGIFYRQVNQSYAAQYEGLIQSGLYKTLAEEGLLVSHQEVEKDLTGTPGWYKTLLPQQIPLISYPGEWCPGQLKDAALLTLKILRIAIDHGMVLKDATPSNVQFTCDGPLFIDTLSFEKYDESRPWVAYRQFCECFLYPLYLHYFHNMGIGRIMTAWPEGIPAAITARLLPLKSRLHLGVWLHVVLPGRIHSDRPTLPPHSFSRTKLIHLTDNLEGIIKRLGESGRGNSIWSNYYQDTVLSKAYLEAKEKLFREFIGEIPFDLALDAGANDGFFSKILEEGKKKVIAIDSDHQCINNLYLSRLGKRDRNPHISGTILPLCIDITNLSTAVCFANAEQTSFLQRVNAGLVIALAIIHHLVLGRNVPLQAAALLFSRLAHPFLIIEFVPIADPKAQALIKRKSQSHSYDEEAFENSFRLHFVILKKEMIPGTERVIFLMQKTDFVSGAKKLV